MNAPIYLVTLADNLHQSANDAGLNILYFQQNNDTKHTAKLKKYFF